MTTKNLNLESVPTDNVDKACEGIAEFIRANDLSFDNIHKIYFALRESGNVLGSKLWTTEDIEMALNDRFGGILEIFGETALSMIPDNIDTEMLDACNDTEWDAITTGIKDSGLFVYVNDIKWDIPEEEYSSEEEYKEIINNLPKQIKIPIAEFEGCTNYKEMISDYLFLSNHGYSPSDFNIVGVGIKAKS